MPSRPPRPPAARPAPHRYGTGLDTQQVFCGDNLEVLKQVADGFVDLVYIDPPFNSNRNYETFWGETKEKRAFEDRHESTRAYIDFMRPRCVELARVLKKTGSFYYHCDWHASHYVKVMLDQIFGEKNFRNEVVWKRSHAHSDAKQGASQFGRVCDSIFFYTAGGRTTWNPQYQPYTPGHLAGEYRHVTPRGRRYKATDVTAAKGGGDTSFAWHVKRGPSDAKWVPDLNDEWESPKPEVRYQTVKPYDGRYWAYSKANLIAFWESGRLTHRETGMPRLMQFADEMPGVPLQDLWTDIDALNARAAERLGYPTQKPLALLERIIAASSDPDDIVLDAFCGCGTALVAAQRLGRRWLGIDVSPTACRVMADRLAKDCHLREGKDFHVVGMPRDVGQLRKMPPFEFQNWAVIALGGVPNKTQSKDMGIDGRVFPVDAIAPGMKAQPGQLDFMDLWYPVQVKQRDKVGRPDIDAFEAVMMREKRTKGFFVAFDYSRDARQEIDRFLRAERRNIVALTVKEILEEEIERKLV